MLEQNRARLYPGSMEPNLAPDQSRPDRRGAFLLLFFALLAVGAALVALVFEVAWYGLIKHVDPMRILNANLLFFWPLRPTWMVLIIGSGVTLLRTDDGEEVGDFKLAA